MRTRLIPIALVAAALLLPAPAHAARMVSYQALLAQVRSGQLIHAVINPPRGDIEIKFRDGSEWKAFYPHGASPRLQRILHERHIRVIFASRHHPKPKPAKVHHHLRYIAAGVLGALVVIGAGLLLYSRRRTGGTGSRPAEATGPAGEAG